MNREDAGIFGSNFLGLSEGAAFAAGGSNFQITYLANWTGTQAGSSFTGGNDVALKAIAGLPGGFVPEPSTSLLAVITGLFAFGRRRRSS
jgi:hypothetical protein